MKKIIITTLLFLFFISGCNSKDPVDSLKCDHDFSDEFSGILENQQVYITSLGQSIDIENLVIRLEHYKVTNYIRENILDTKQIPSGSAIIIVAGCSIKGLGDAGISVNEEIERAKVLKELKKSKDLLIIVFHIGGNNRRGATSDHLIEQTFEIADLIIFLASGNEDNYLCKLATDFKIPHREFPSIGHMDVALIDLFNIDL